MKSGKIGIATITVKGAYNYGNKLQSYALQQFLRQEGFVPQTIRYEASYVHGIRQTPQKMQWQKMFSQPVLQSLDDTARIIRRRILKTKLDALNSKRTSGFEAFDKHINYTDETYYCHSSFDELRQRYDCLITGSDQVWNPYYEGMDPFYYLHFAEKGKRISYAPSVAVEEIPEERKTDIGRWIREIDHLSIRESAGRALLAREYGVDARIVCDPVFLLSPEQWQAVTEDPAENGRYFAVYLLGMKTVDTKKLIRKLEKRFGIPAVDLYTRDDPGSVFASPEEFLGLIKNADFVLTDSFHGTAFSILFETPMLIVNRSSQHTMSSRIENLLEIIGAGNRSASYILENPDRLEMDFQKGRKQLDQFVDSSKAFLLSAVNDCIENS